MDVIWSLVLETYGVVVAVVAVAVAVVVVVAAAAAAAAVVVVVVVVVVLQGSVTAGTKNAGEQNMSNMDQHYIAQEKQDRINK